MKPKIAIVVITGFCVMALIACGFVAFGPRPVLVAKRNLEIGELIRKPEDLFEEKSLSYFDLPANAIRNMDRLKGRQVKVRRLKGDFIAPDELTEPNHIDFVRSMVPGYRAVSLTVDAESTPFDNLANSHIDVVCSVLREKQTYTMVVLENVFVLAAERCDHRDPYGNEQPASIIATLSLIPEDALKLQAARELGSISFMLRPVGDAKASGLSGVRFQVQVPSDEVVTKATSARDPELAPKELEWASGIAKHFLTCIHKKDHTALVALMTDRLGAKADNTPGWVDSFFLREFALPNNGKSMILFRGELHGFRFETDERIKGSFTMRVVKEGETGQWRVGVFSCDVSVVGHGK